MVTQLQKPVVVVKKRVHKFGEFDLLKAAAILGLPAVYLIEEGIKVNKFLARITSFRRRKRKSRQK